MSIFSSKYTGSIETTGSFGRVDASTGSFGIITGDGSNLSNLPNAAINTYNTSGDNRVITSVNSSTVQGEEKLTFDGTTLTIDGNVSASGNVVAENYIVKSTKTEMTTSFSSGSTIFGDTQDDTHQFTGSLFITGSILSNNLGLISSSAQIASDISGSLGPNASDIRQLTKTGISGSLGPNASDIRQLTRSGISGSLGPNATVIRSLTKDGISGSLGPNATDIRSLTKASISGSLSKEHLFTKVPGIISSSVLSSGTQGTITLTTNDVAVNVDSGLQTTDKPTFAGLTIQGDISASGDITADNYIVRNTVTQMTQSFSSGSTILF